MKEQLAQWVRRFCLNSKQATPCDGEGEFSLREGSRRVIPGIGKGGGFTRGGVWEGLPWELDSGFQEGSPCSTRPES